jgi:SOS-response transcriptional repressor LexA
MNDLSMLQKRVLVFIKSFMNNYGYPPTVREIAKGTDIGSTSTVHSSLNALEQKGYIYRDVGQSRSIVLAGMNAESGVYSIPLLDGDDESKVGFVDVPKSMILDRQGVFALKITCSLDEKSILSGDVLVVKAFDKDIPQSEIRKQLKDGDTVVYDNRTVGVFWETSGNKSIKGYGVYDAYDAYDASEGFDESVALAELYSMDYYSDEADDENNSDNYDDYDNDSEYSEYASFDKKIKIKKHTDKIIGKVIASIRIF